MPSSVILGGIAEKQLRLVLSFLAHDSPGVLFDHNYKPLSKNALRSLVIQFIQQWDQDAGILTNTNIHNKFNTYLKAAQDAQTNFYGTQAFIQRELRKSVVDYGNDKIDQFCWRRDIRSVKQLRKQLLAFQPGIIDKPLVLEHFMRPDGTLRKTKKEICLALAHIPNPRRQKLLSAGLQALLSGASLLRRRVQRVNYI